MFYFANYISKVFFILEYKKELQKGEQIYTILRNCPEILKEVLSSLDTHAYDLYRGYKHACHFFLSPIAQQMRILNSFSFRNLKREHYRNIFKTIFSVWAPQQTRSCTFAYFAIPPSVWAPQQMTFSKNLFLN